MGRVDAAETDRLTEAIQSILPALESFNRTTESSDFAGSRSTWESRLSGPLPDRGTGLDGVLDELARTVIPNGLPTGAPGFSGWVTTAPTTSAAAAALAGTVAGAQRWWVQAFNHLETVGLRWLAELLGLPPRWQGTFTSGGSVANLVALGAARQWAFEKKGVDCAANGLPSDVPWRLYSSTEVHHVVTRAAGVLGLGRRAVAAVPVDASQRIDVEELLRTLAEDRRRGIVPIAIIATAGTVNTGAVDPIAQLVEIARDYDTWLHVDGAYGLFGLLDPRVAPLYAGLEQADSVAVDPHKWLAAPVGCGAAYVRDRELLGRAFTMEPAEYLEGAASRSEIRSTFDDFGELYHDFNVEQSAPSRGVQVWAVLCEIGRQGMRDRVVRHNDFARHLAARVREDDRLELLTEPVLSICCFRYRAPDLSDDETDALNVEITAHLRARGKLVPSTTRVDGRLAIRPCYINPRTTRAEVDGLADAVRTIGDRLIETR